AVEAMRVAFDAMDIRGTVVIGEGERDEAPMLFIGERVGAGWRGDGTGSPRVDIAVDPLEGTNLCATGAPDAISVIAIADDGQVGARIRLIGDGDVSGAVMTANPDSGIDVLFGTGGAPEGVIAAAALKCVGGELQGRLRFRSDEERARAVRMGVKSEDTI